jgi:hypothetical protein
LANVIKQFCDKLPLYLHSQGLKYMSVYIIVDQFPMLNSFVVKSYMIQRQNIFHILANKVWG